MGVTAAPTTPHGFIGNLEVQSLIVDGQAVLRLRGELDVSSAEIFADAARLAHAQGTPTIVLDLSGLQFIDSSGLRQFVVALKRERETGGDVVLRAPTDRTGRLLEIVGLDKIFTIDAGGKVFPAAGTAHGSTPEDERERDPGRPRTASSAQAREEASGR